MIISEDIVSELDCQVGKGPECKMNGGAHRAPVSRVPNPIIEDHDALGAEGEIAVIVDGKFVQMKPMRNVLVSVVKSWRLSIV
jgi:hypothetical protein